MKPCESSSIQHSIKYVLYLYLACLLVYFKKALFSHRIYDYGVCNSDEMLFINSKRGNYFVLHVNHIIRKMNIMTVSKIKIKCIFLSIHNCMWFCFK